MSETAEDRSGTSKKSAGQKSTDTKSVKAKSAKAKSAKAKEMLKNKDTVKKNTVKKVSVKKETTKRSASGKGAAKAKVEIVDTIVDTVEFVDIAENVADNVVESKPLNDNIVTEPILIEDSTTGNRNFGESEERHGGLLNMLYRHPHQRMVSGVCGGIADYLGWDAMIVRALWVVFSLMTFGTAGLLAYAVLSLLLPVGTKANGFIRSGKIALTEENMGRASYALIGVGVLMLLSNLGVLSLLFDGARAVIGFIFWPAVLVTVGLLLLNRNGDKNYEDVFKNGLNTVRERANEARVSSRLPQSDTIRNSFAEFRSKMPLKRSHSNRIVAGLCGGIGGAIDVDANLVRLGFAVTTLVTAGTPIFIYILLAVLLPSDGGPRVRQNDIIIETKEVIIKDEDLSI